MMVGSTRAHAAAEPPTLSSAARSSAIEPKNAPRADGGVAACARCCRLLLRLIDGLAVLLLVTCDLPARILDGHALRFCESLSGALARVLGS